MKPATLGQIATIALLLLGRGIAREGDLAGVYHDLLAYTPDRCPVQLDASASVAASVSIAPDILTELKRSTKGPALDAYFIALGRVLTEDVAGSGMFARVQPPAGPAPDYAVQVQCEMFDLADFHLRISLQVLEPATRRIAVSKILMVPLGIAWGKARRGVPDIRAIPGHYPDLNGGTLRATINNTKFYMQQLMATLKAKAAEDLQYQRKLPAALESIRSARLPDLLVASDPFVAIARERNRAIVAAKNQQLPAILRDTKTDELSALVVRIEQAILDLNHESEVAKDRAQQAMASNGPAGQIEELRGLTISYRERIELLKPILSALKEEIANRNR